MDPSTTLGPLSMAKQVENLKSQVKISVDKGAKIVYGDLNYKINDSNQSLHNGYFFNPMILENINKDQPAYHEELFGPVFSMFKFNDPVEVIELANATNYGLSACIFTEDMQRARRKALLLEVGTVFVNEIVVSDPAIPNGGIKDSGYGRECYKDGIQETMNRKTIVYGK